MTELLTHATLPDGRYAALGDTAHSPAAAISGTTAEYAATGGRHGPRPKNTFATFKAGFVFGRTGWGEQRIFRHEMVWTGRFGPGRAFHGHLDHGAVTLFGFGRRLVDDPGLFTLNANAWRTFATGRSAHNVLTVDGVRYDPSSLATLVAATSDARHDDVTIRDKGYPGADLHRRVVFSRRMGWLLVDDRATLAASRTVRQLWHLLPGSNVRRAGPAFRTHQAGGNLLILQLRRPAATRIVEGERAPIQGWYSTGLNKRQPAPVVESAMTGERVRYLTLLVPLPYCNADVRVTDISATSSATSFTVSIDGVAERVEISNDRVVLTMRPTQRQSREVDVVRRAGGRADQEPDRTARLCRDAMQQPG